MGTALCSSPRTELRVGGLDRRVSHSRHGVVSVLRSFRDYIGLRPQAIGARGSFLADSLDGATTRLAVATDLSAKRNARDEARVAPVTGALEAEGEVQPTERHRDDFLVLDFIWTIE